MSCMGAATFANVRALAMEHMVTCQVSVSYCRLPKISWQGPRKEQLPHQVQVPHLSEMNTVRHSSTPKGSNLDCDTNSPNSERIIPTSGQVFTQRPFVFNWPITISIKRSHGQKAQQIYPVKMSRANYD